MRKGLQYLGLAENCRKLAKQTKNRLHKKQLEDMARLWESLAIGRAKRIAKTAKAPRKSK